MTKHFLTIVIECELFFFFFSDKESIQSSFLQYQHKPQSEKE